MKRLIVFILLFAPALIVLSQNRIVLKTGKTIKEARLFKEHALYITYERRYSLHDLDKKKIEYIESDSAIIKYLEDGTAYVRYKYARPQSQVPSQSIKPQVEPESEEQPRIPQTKANQSSQIQDYRNANSTSSPLERGNVNLGVSWLAAGGVGLAAGVAGAFAGVLTGLAVDQPGAGATFGSLAGVSLGAAVGAKVVGEVKFGQGAFGEALIGSSIGTALGAGLVLAAVNEGNGFYVIPALFLPATGAVIGYRVGMTRRSQKKADLSLYPTSTGVGMTLRF